MDLDINFRTRETSSRLRQIGWTLLVGAISVSPRIPIAIIPGGRRLDLRVEDFVLVLLLAGWMPYASLRRRLYWTPLIKPLGTYVCLSMFCTSLGILIGDLNATRAAFYVLKEIEYFVIFLLSANMVRTMKDLKNAVAIFTVGGMVNAVWVGFQLLTGTKRAFFEVPTTVGFGGNVTILYSYGPTLIGEISPLSTGGFFLVGFFVVFGLAATFRSGYQRLILFALSVVLAGAGFSSLSRASIFGGIASLAILLVLLGRKRLLLWIVALGGAVLPVASYVMGSLPFSNRVFDIEGLRYGVVESRLELIWEPLLQVLDQGFKGLLFGFGKSSLGIIPGLPFEEAHNHYLRIFLETGIFGSVAFLWLLVSLVQLSRGLFKNGKLSIAKGLALSTLGVTIALAIGALAQDTFVPVKVMEPFWFTVGLTAAAYKLELEKRLTGTVVQETPLSQAMINRKDATSHDSARRKALGYRYHSY